MTRMLFFAVAIAALGVRVGSAPTDSGGIVIRALATDPSLVTGGDVLIEIVAPTAPRVSANGRDVSAAFKPSKQINTFVGLVTGLVNGTNTIAAGSARLPITNYPITGPVLSGPWQQ